MPLFSIPNVRIRGIAGCVPKQQESNYDYDWIGEKERNLLVKTTGVEKRRVAEKGVTASDLCYPCADSLMGTLPWAKEEVDAVVFVSQTSDFVMPATAVILQHRLGLSKHCLAFDVSLGCSGYVYGLAIIASLMSNAGARKGLLLVGDLSTLYLNRRDKSTYPIFGDAGTATALEFDPSAPSMDFNLQSDGSGSEAIIIPGGKVRNPLDDDTTKETEVAKGIWRHQLNLWMDGTEVFNFALREVAPNVRALYGHNGTSSADYDYFIFHQANKLMNETIRKQLKLEPGKVPYSLSEFGNTSSASVPLTIVTELREEASQGRLSMLMAGFGVGLSWGSVAVTTEQMVCPELIEI